MEQVVDTKVESVEYLVKRRQALEESDRRCAHTRRTEDHLALFFEHSLDLLCIAGFDGYFKRLNRLWTRCLGWTVSELEATPFLDFVHPDDRDATRAELDKLADGAETTLFENRYRHRDGSYRWLRWNARAMFGPPRIYATARDVTDQKRLEKQILEIADREKERLGSELHDGLCQTLAGIAALSSTLSRQLAANSESAASAEAAEITRLLKDAINEAHDLAHGLGPMGLDHTGLDGALGTLADSIQHLFGLSCTFACDSPTFGLSRDIESHLFRIAQEAVNNAVAHGEGGQIEIRLDVKDGEGVLSVRDDGVGVPENICSSDGIGMYTMAYRARLIGGTLDVRRCGQRGTVVTCCFPLPDTGTNQSDDCNAT